MTKSRTSRRGSGVLDRMTGRTVLAAAAGVLGFVWAGAVPAEPLTADRAVSIALQRSSQVVNAQADIMDARGSLYTAYSGMLPRLSADWTRSGTRVDHQGGNQLFGNVVTPSTTVDSRSYSTTPSISGTWSVLNLSSIKGLASGRHGLQASKLRGQAARNEVALGTRRQFYEVVKAIHLAQVADGTLGRARDDERRVRALFEVGSVSRSDLLKAQVATAQSQLDSLTAHQNVIVQRILLSELLAMPESQLGEVDTTLAVEAHDYDEPALIAEASRNRPDLRASEAELRAARAGVASARFARLPYITVSGAADFNPRRTFSQKSLGTFTRFGPSHVDANGFVVQDSIGTVTDPVSSGESKSDRTLQGSIAITWDIFTGFATDARVTSARARQLRAQDARDALQRNLEAEVHQALLDYRKALESREVATRALESATENLNLTQQKYNVGSATILELIDAQVQLQRAESDGVSAQAAIRVAEAQINRVRGRNE